MKGVDEDGDTKTSRGKVRRKEGDLTGKKSGKKYVREYKKNVLKTFKQEKNQR